MKENQPDGQQHQPQERQREFQNESGKRRYADFLLIGNGYNREIRPVAEAGGRAEKLPWHANAGQTETT